jgi:glycosyltransferase involved in cell wall biosynthesis
MTSDISIYIPVYNAESTIKQCINSILSQNLKPLEILVINDCSTDNSLGILQNYGEKIKIINNKKNMGLSYSRNLAKENLKSRFVASIDSDVEISPNWVELLLKKALEENVTLIGGKMYEKYTQNRFNFWRSKRLGQNWGEEDLENPKFVFGCNNILDTKRINSKLQYPDYDEYFKTNGEDIEFSELLKKDNLKLYYHSAATCFHLQNDNGLSLSKRYWRYIYYGDGLKKRNFFKTFKNVLRQIKKTFKWSILDLFSKNLKLIPVNFIILYYFIILDFKFYKKNKS